MQPGCATGCYSQWRIISSSGLAVVYSGSSGMCTLGDWGHGKQDQVSHVLRLPEPRRVVAMVVAAHLRVHRPRFDQRGLDAVAAPLLPGDAGESAHAELGGAVGTIVGARMPAGERRHVEDVAAPALAHVAEHRLSAQEHRLEVDRDVEVPQFLGDLRYGGGAGDPGVVDQDVDRAEAVDGLRHHRLHRRLVGDVGGDGQRLVAERPDLPGHRLYLGRGPRRQRDVGSLARQCERGRPADAAPGPGNDGGLILQFHVKAPCRSNGGWRGYDSDTNRVGPVICSK